MARCEKLDSEKGAKKAADGRGRGTQYSLPVRSGLVRRRLCSEWKEETVQIEFAVTVSQGHGRLPIWQKCG